MAIKRRRSGMRKIWTSVRRFFSLLRFRKPSPPKRKVIYLNIAVGIAIAIFFHWVEDTEWGELQLNRVFDLFVRYESAKLTRSNASKIVFVDIEKETYEKWNRPSITPRDKIADLVDVAYQGGASVIVLDFLFEDPDCYNEGGDGKLRNLLKQIDEDRKTRRKDSTPSSPKIILPVRMGYDRQLRKTLFDDFANQVNIFYGLPYVSAPANDLTVRYWVTYDIARNGQGEKRVLWGMPLLAAVLAQGDMADLDKLGEKIVRNDKKKTHDIGLHALPEGRKVKVAFPSQGNREDLYLQRIRYFLIPPPSQISNGKGESGAPEVRPNLLNDMVLASELTGDGQKKKETFAGFFKGKIVIIGNSISDVGDIHLTPVGRMAGMYIIGNSLYTIMNGLQIKHPPLWAVYLMESAVIAIAAYLFVTYASLPAQFISSIILVAIFGPLSLYLYMKTGVFLNFVLSVWGMSLHRIVTNMEELFEARE